MKQKNNVRLLTQLALLVAIQIIFTATPLGFLSIGAMSITLVHLPVLIGAMVLGPKGGSFLGLVFGISSMVTATMRGTPDAVVFSPFLSKSLWSVVICIVPRILFGLITAYLFLFLKKRLKYEKLAVGIAAACGSLLHSIMVLGSIYLLLGDMYAQYAQMGKEVLIGFFAFVVATNGVIEAVVGVLVCVLAVPPLLKTQGTLPD